MKRGSHEEPFSSPRRDAAFITRPSAARAGSQLNAGALRLPNAGALRLPNAGAMVVQLRFPMHARALRPNTGAMAVQLWFPTQAGSIFRGVRVIAP